MPKILVVADSEIASLIEGVFKGAACHVVAVQDKDEAHGLLARGDCDLVVCEFTEEDMAGRSFLDDLVADQPDIPCVIWARAAELRHAVEAVKRGAYDCIAASDPPENIRATLEQAMSRASMLEFKRRKEDQTPGYKFVDLVGESPAIQKVFKTIGKVARSESTVLITGESGTGKELIARAIHHNSARMGTPMVVINCGAIPGELLESELFGHEKGAFTGAHRTRIGRFELADGGTIFLDEIGDMSPDLQVKLLRVLQEQTFERVGSTRTMKVDIRVLAATNKDLASAMEAGEFREDLYYRLNVIPIEVPPLRKRKSDIPLLINFFLTRLGGRRRQDLKRMKSFTEPALEAMMKYNWPGNIRELENLMERLSVLVEGEEVLLEDLPDRIRGTDGNVFPSLLTTLESGLGFNDAVELYQRSLILQALERTNWVKAKAAALLKMNRTTLVEKIKKMKIEAPDNTPSPRL